MPTDRKYTAEEIKQLMSPPRMIRGETEEAYWKWWSAFVDSYQPERLSDWLDVNQLATKQWEQERIQRSNAALVDATMIEALKNLLRPLQSQMTHGLGILHPHKIAHDYYFGDEQERQEASAELEIHNITDDQILAEAMQICAGSLIMFDRLDGYRTNAKRALQKELDRRSEDRRFRFEIVESQVKIAESQTETIESQEEGSLEGS
jgi:hypothetical protein